MRLTRVHVARPFPSGTHYRSCYRQTATFSGRGDVAIPPGAEFISGPIDMPMAPLSNARRETRLDQGRKGARIKGKMLHPSRHVSDDFLKNLFTLFKQRKSQSVSNCKETNSRPSGMHTTRAIFTDKGFRQGLNSLKYSGLRVNPYARKTNPINPSPTTVQRPDRMKRATDITDDECSRFDLALQFYN